MIQKGFHFVTVVLLAAGAAGSLCASAMSPAAAISPAAEGSASGLLLAGAVLVGIGRFRRRKP